MDDEEEKRPERAYYLEWRDGQAYTSVGRQALGSGASTQAPQGKPSQNALSKGLTVASSEDAEAGKRPIVNGSRCTAMR